MSNHILYFSILRDFDQQKLRGAKKVDLDLNDKRVSFVGCREKELSVRIFHLIQEIT